MKDKRLAMRACLSVLLLILAVSIDHLAYGIQLATGIETWEAWAMAIAIDAGMIASEFSALVDRPTKYTRFSVILGLILSGIFNCLAFTYHATTALYIGIGVVLGVLVPTSLYALTQSAHTLRRRNPRILTTTKKSKSRR
ncbi:MAG: hypothetical protein MN733_10440 [Nitrososphaera sp.]|nr:hypothetical protein [Nitrososphaera sp.]